MNQHTKNKRKWHGELMAWYEANDIRYCERCGSTFGVAPAHRVKQRFIRDRDEYFQAAYLCQPCHSWAEYGTKEDPGTHNRMFEIITEIIEGR